MPEALLLSPDDQAVNAITGVLEEMSVLCERPLDGVSAAQKLNSHNFDLVLVDCENLPAAKLIFDVCRRGKGGNNPVPIAIVDGRAGLPTAFRLGAELILTKPVAKDQARTTIRAAVSRLRREIPGEVVVQTASAGIVKEPALNPAAPQLTSFAEPAPPRPRGTVPPSYLTAALSASLNTKMQDTMEEVERGREGSLKSNPQPPSDSGTSEPPPSRTEMPAKPARPLNLSDDLVLAELDRTEMAAAAAKPADTKPAGAGAEKAAAKTTPAESGRDLFSSYSYSRRPLRTRAPQIALLMLLCAGGGFYAAWTYQPGFRETAQPKINRLLELGGMALPPTHAPNPAKPSAQVAVVKTPASAPANSNLKPSSKPADSTASAVTGAATSAASTPVANVNPSSSSGTPSSSAPDNGKATENEKKKGPAAPSSGSLLPGEDSAVILSSKGAEKRLAHSVPPKYPANLHSPNAQGTVVLKTLISENGEVEGVRLVDGDAILATAAMDAVRQWRYRPYVRDGKALPFQTVVIIDFQLP